MLLSALLVAKELKPYIPAALIAVPAVPYFIGTLSWHAVSVFLPETTFRMVDDKMYSAYQRLIMFVFEHLSGVRVEFGGDVAECFAKKENVLYISNHQCSVDWVVADMLAARQGSLGHLRYMLKDVLQYVPLYGWYFYRHGCVYVRRSGQFRSDVASKQLEYLAKMQVPLWMVIFPEGTRYTPKKQKAIETSRRFAESRGLSPLSHVLTPRIKGVKLALDYLRHKKLNAVYDVTIIYDQSKVNGRRVEAPDMFDYACAPAGSTLYVHVTRIPIDDVPNEDEKLELWLYDLFRRKEKYLSEFYVSSTLPNGMRDAPNDFVLPLSFTLPYAAFFVSVTCAMLATNVGRKIYLAAGFFGTIGGIAYMKLKRAA